ncbi:MAG: hypothetical protein MUD08_13190 [Cytophagales bacterium]|jgi:hypothetical protein|nr:hypothetical protein [Cytophagales bacterium]
MKNLDFHDSAVVKIEFKTSHSVLTLGIVAPTGVHYEMIAVDAIHWELSPFEVQNILFDMRIFDKLTMPFSVIDEYGIGEYGMNLIKIQNYQIIILDPSVGMGGYIIAGQVEIKNRLIYNE